MTEKLLEVENETMMKVADLEKLLLQKDKDLQVIRVSCNDVILLACLASERLHFTSLLVEIVFRCMQLNYCDSKLGHQETGCFFGMESHCAVLFITPW